MQALVHGLPSDYMVQTYGWMPFMMSELLLQVKLLEGAVQAAGNSNAAW
jgi:hypothetical protein